MAPANNKFDGVLQRLMEKNTMEECSDNNKCESCNNIIHATCGITVGTEGCGSKVVCVMCQVEQDINLERNEAHKGLKRAAEKMIDTTVKKMPKLDV